VDGILIRQVWAPQKVGFSLVKSCNAEVGGPCPKW